MKICVCCSLRGGASAHGVYILKEDGARIGQPGRETVRHLLRHARSEVVLPAAPQVPPNGETVACCVVVGKVPLSQLTHGWKVEKIKQLHFILRQDCLQLFILQMQYFVLPFV